MLVKGAYGILQVIWQPYFMGLIIQFVFGLVVLRWTAGFKAFEWAGKKVTTFLAYTDAATAFVFGDNLLGTGTTQFFHELIFVVGRHILPLHGASHDDVIKWKHFPRYWPFVQGIHRWPVNSPHKRPVMLMFSLICAWINGWVNNRGASDLRRHCAHYDVTVMSDTVCNASECTYNRWYEC